MITFRGTALVATAIFTFFLARVTQVGWLYLLDSALWGIVLVSLGMPTLAVMSLQVSHRLARQDCLPSSPGPAEGVLATSKSVPLLLRRDQGEMAVL